MKDNPLDRIRAYGSKCIESAENCYSIVILTENGSQLVLPYAHLIGVVSECQKCVLAHSLATVMISGPIDLIEELAQLLSRQRLAVVRHDYKRVTVTADLKHVQ